MKFRTAPFLALALALALVACGPAPAATPDASADACTTSSPTEACVAIVEAACDRILECCAVQPRPSGCPSWTTTRECRTALAAQSADFDCATATGRTVCRASVDACTAQYPRLACADVLNGTAHVMCQ